MITCWLNLSLPGQDPTLNHGSHHCIHYWCSSRTYYQGGPTLQFFNAIFWWIVHVLSRVRWVDNFQKAVSEERNVLGELWEHGWGFSNASQFEPEATPYSRMCKLNPDPETLQWGKRTRVNGNSEYCTKQTTLLSNLDSVLSQLDDGCYCAEAVSVFESVTDFCNKRLCAGVSQLLKTLYLISGKWS